MASAGAMPPNGGSHHHVAGQEGQKTTPPKPRLSEILPPIILGTATFNVQYVFDPSQMPAQAIVARAFELGIRAFDTSPYYGPAEILLGKAIALAASPPVTPESSAPLPPKFPRSSYLLISKAGRVGSDLFDYSPSAVTASVKRSLERLKTPYLDLVYLHDVEFVTDAEVSGALSALRALQADGLVRYVGISGYPVPRLLSLAEQAKLSGNPVDAVLSYGHCTVQNTLLAQPLTLAKFRAAGVDVLLNASILGMGLLTPSIDAGPQERWHPAPLPLRQACIKLRGESEEKAGRRLEGIAIRYALEEWSRVASAAGFGVPVEKGSPPGTGKVGATVIGVTNIAELEQTMAIWKGVVRDLGLKPEVSNGHSSNGHTENGHGGLIVAEGGLSPVRPMEIAGFVRDVLWPVLGEWKDHSWASPPVGWFEEREKVKAMTQAAVDPAA